MKKGVWFISLAFLCFFPLTRAEFILCDHANPSFTGSTLEEICHNGNIISPVWEMLPPLEGSLFDTRSGYWGNEYSLSGTRLSYETPLWYWGNQFWDEQGQKTIQKIAFHTPVGYFSEYQSGSFLFPSLESLHYTTQKIFFSAPETDSWGWGGSSERKRNICKRPEPLKAITSQVEKNAYSNRIRISWELWDAKTKVKVIQSYPRSDVWYLESGKKEFFQRDLQNNTSYHYFLVPYNECGDGLYSDSIKVEYKNEDEEEIETPVSKYRLSQEESLNILAWENAKEQYYFLDIEAEETLDFETFSWLLINTKTSVILREKSIAFHTLKELWVFPVSLLGTKPIPYKDFLRTISKLPSHFWDDVRSVLENTYRFKEKDIFESAQELQIIQQWLKERDEYQKRLVLWCLQYESCEDIWVYHSFMAERKKEKSRSDPEALGINIQNQNPVTRSEYTAILLRTLWSQAFYSWWYRRDEYNTFIEVLVQALKHQWVWWGNELGFLEYETLRSDLLENKRIYDKIEHITQVHLKTINTIHQNTQKREDLYGILKDYLY